MGLIPLKSGFDCPNTYRRFVEMFPDDAACLAYLAKLRWSEGFVCPTCKTVYATPLCMSYKRKNAVPRSKTGKTALVFCAKTICANPGFLLRPSDKYKKSREKLRHRENLVSTPDCCQVLSKMWLAAVSLRQPLYPNPPSLPLS